MELTQKEYRDKEAADQRCKYGEIMLRHDHEYLTSQRAFEVEAQARLDAASQRRQHEKMRLEAAEPSAPKWKNFDTKQRSSLKSDALLVGSEEERERKAKRALKKVRTEIESGDEAVNGGEPKKGKGQLKKVNNQEKVV
ncbi:hypothetical protein EDD16DRAFT_1700249 [Pisolithus croceorrhizus]|nr:hypothetical protein EDD16DRAFT_1700249 [Pisolithus croceorrhizus]